MYSLIGDIYDTISCKLSHTKQFANRKPTRHQLHWNVYKLYGDDGNGTSVLQSGHDNVTCIAS